MEWGLRGEGVVGRIGFEVHIMWASGDLVGVADWYFHFRNMVE